MVGLSGERPEGKPPTVGEVYSGIPERRVACSAEEMLVVIVVYKDGGDFAYEDIRSWKIQGQYLILTQSRHEHILIPQDSFTSVEIREEASNGN